jgi:transposase InsO family protein/uncharacterized membrane protein
MPAAVEARIVGLRREHPGWGPSRIRWELERSGVVPLPGRSAVYRALIRHGLVDPKKRKRRREDYRRWERGRAMELWQMDVMGRVHLADGTELKVVTGIDDHSRFVVCAKAVARATARPVCQALSEALGRHGIPEQILTDNGKVFTARFGQGPGPVMFDQICSDNGIKHLLTAPYSPTTTGKVERLHKTMRAEFFNRADSVFATMAEFQAALDAWVGEYNTARPHQSCGGRPPAERFALADQSIVPEHSGARPEPPQVAASVPGKRPAGVSRWVNAHGKISLAGFSYAVGATYAGEPVEVVVSGGLAGILHAGVVVATHAQRLRPDQAARSPRAAARVGELAVVLIAAAVLRRSLSPRGARGRLLLAAACAGAIDVAANICYVAATRTGVFGLAVVLASLYPGVTVLLARGVLGERLRWAQRAGLGLAAIGIILVAA